MPSVVGGNPVTNVMAEAAVPSVTDRRKSSKPSVLHDRARKDNSRLRLSVLGGPGLLSVVASPLLPFVLRREIQLIKIRRRTADVPDPKDPKKKRTVPTYGIGEGFQNPPFGHPGGSDPPRPPYPPRPSNLDVQAEQLGDFMSRWEKLYQFLAVFTDKDGRVITEDKVDITDAIVSGGAAESSGAGGNVKGITHSSTQVESDKLDALNAADQADPNNPNKTPKAWNDFHLFLHRALSYETNTDPRNKAAEERANAIDKEADSEGNVAVAHYVKAN